MSEPGQEESYATGCFGQMRRACDRAEMIMAQVTALSIQIPLVRMDHLHEQAFGPMPQGCGPALRRCDET